MGCTPGDRPPLLLWAGIRSRFSVTNNTRSACLTQAGELWRQAEPCEHGLLGGLSLQRQVVGWAPSRRTVGLQRGDALVLIAHGLHGIGVRHALASAVRRPAWLSVEDAMSDSFSGQRRSVSADCWPTGSVNPAQDEQVLQ